MGMLTMGLMCVLVACLVGALFVLGAVRRSNRPRRLSDVERDYDDGPPRGEQ